MSLHNEQHATYHTHVDVEGKIAWADRYAEGLNPSDVIGQCVDAWASSSVDAEKVRNAVSRCITFNETVDFEYKATLPDRPPESFLCKVMPTKNVAAHMTGRWIPDAMQTLSTREFQVLLAALHCPTDKAIATNLGISTSSVSTYFRRAADKLGMSNRNEIVTFVARHLS